MDAYTRISNYKDFIGELKVSYKRTDTPTVKVTQSKDAINFIRKYFDECMDDHEEVKVIHLNNANMIVNVDHHSKGGITSSTIDFKLILQKALLIKCTGLILCHNHPSSKLLPSKSDINISNKLKEACSIVGLILLDSLILTREDYYSLSDSGEL